MFLLAFRITKPADTTSNSSQDTNSSVNNTGLASSTAENNIEQVQVTTFHDVEVPNRFITPMGQNNSSIRDMDDTHSIIQFLERPTVVGQFQLSTAAGDQTVPLRRFITDTGTPQKPVFSYEFPSRLIDRGGKAQKLQNFKYLRANIMVKIVLNANPFVGGRFYVTYSPYENNLQSNARKQLMSSRAGVSAYPGVELDLQLDNSIEIELPFASYKEAYDLTLGEDYLQLNMFAISPLLGPTNATAFVDFTVFAWFKDIQLTIPTFDNVSASYDTSAVPAVIYKERELSAKDKERLLTARSIEKLKRTDPTIYDYIFKYIGRPVSMQVQTENFSQGPISEIASSVDNIVNAATKIPIIGEIASSIATPVKWVTTGIRAVASIFGWSKPTADVAINPYVNIPALGYTHYKGVDQGVSLALSSENQLQLPVDVFPSGIDEMDLRYVCANPGIKAVVNWTKTHPLNVPLKSVETGYSLNEGVQPVGIGTYSSLQFSVSDDGNKVTNLSICDTVPCEFVSSLFTYWRATMCFKVSVVKTAFHTGRLEILFNPGMYPRLDNGALVPDDVRIANMDSSNNYKYILDLTNDTEVTIRIPYVSSKLFQNTAGVLGYSASLNEYQVEDTLTGALIIRPITKLLAPDTVSDHVSVIIWKWAEDVELVAPTPSALQILKVFEPISKVPTMKVQMQINISNKAEGNVINFFDSSSASKQNLSALLMACGEKIYNLRILLRCAREIDLQPVANVIQNNAVGTMSAGKPLFFNVQDDQYGKDYLSFISYMYRFFRGGLRYKVFTEATGAAPGYADGSNVKSMVRSFITQNISQNEIAEKIFNQTQGPTHTTYVDLNPVHEINVPYYSQYRKLPISLAPNYEVMTAAVTSNVDNVMRVLRSGNDDMSFGWLMGTPQLVDNSVTSAPDYVYPPANTVVPDLTNANKCDKTWDYAQWFTALRTEVTDALLASPHFVRVINPIVGATLVQFRIPKSDTTVPGDKYFTGGGKGLHLVNNTNFKTYDEFMSECGDKNRLSS